MNFLTGKKTYLSVLCAVIVFVIWTLGFIDEKAMTLLLTFFGFTGLAGLRIAIQKVLKLGTAE